MTLQAQQPQPEKTPALLTDEQRRRVADALENAQSEYTRKNYDSQLRQFRSRCKQENYSPLPAQSGVLAAYAVELADDGKSMSDGPACGRGNHGRSQARGPVVYADCRRHRNSSEPVTLDSR